MNLSSAEANKLLDKSLRGKTFEDGPYQYRIFVSSSAMRDDSAGMILTVTNTPDSVGGDLIQYAISRIGIILRHYKPGMRILPTKIWVDEYGHNVNFLPLIGGDLRGEYLHTGDVKDIHNMFGSFSIKNFNENHLKVKKKMIKFLDHVGDRFSNFDLPAVPAEYMKDFKKKLLPVIQQEHPVKSKIEIPPVNFKITKMEGTSDVTYNGSSSDVDEVLKFKYKAAMTIVADKTNPLIKTIDKVLNKYESEGRDIARDIIYAYQHKITDAIDSYINNFSPVECDISYTFFYGQTMQGSGSR